jgi:hypothetical protein
MTRDAAENGPKNADSPAGPNSYPDLDRQARANAQLLPPQSGMLECDRHSYPSPPQRLHKGSTPTGGSGGGLLH